MLIARYLSTERHAEIAIPGWGFELRKIDALLAHSDVLATVPPWEERIPKAFGHYYQYSVVPQGAKRTRDNQLTTDLRPYINTNVSTAFPEYLDMSNAPGRGLPVDRMNKYRYLAIVDGISSTNRLLEALPLGSLVIKQKSVFTQHFEHVMIPYQHFVPFWENYAEDIADVVEWARTHDAEARRIAENGRQFALKYLRKLARQCYWRQLFLELAPLQANVSSVHTLPAFEMETAKRWLEEQEAIRRGQARPRP